MTQVPFSHVKNQTTSVSTYNDNRRTSPLNAPSSTIDIELWERFLKNGLQQLKAPYSSKIDILLSKNMFNILIFGNNTIIKYGT